MEDSGRSITKYLVELVAVVLMAALFVWAWCDMYYSESADPDIPHEIITEALEKDIYLDGKLYNNWELKRPVLMTEGRVYLPVDEKNCVCLETDGKQENDLENVSVSTGYHYEINSNPVGLDQLLILPNGERYLAARALMDNGICDAYYTSGGFYISTGDISAAEYADANPNESYIAGRVAYMQRMNTELSDYDAYRLEYLFRHVAATTNSATPDLLLSVARMESNFNIIIGTRTVGLMQVMLKYAQRKGFTYEDLCDPHANIHYGAMYISDRLDYFGGDEVKALAAYNRGLAAVLLSGDYSSAYADRILSSRRAMYAWLAQNGYNKEFVDYIELNAKE